MDNILNKEGIKKYSQRFSKIILDTHFGSNKVVSGEQIKSFTAIPQVNMFAIKGLFEAWQNEMSKLESPYFDYTARDVQTAMTSFMNVLSRNISVSRSNFSPLLERAVEESILLIFSPFDFYAHLSEHYSGEITVENLKKLQRYIKVNKNIIDTIITKMESKEIVKADEKEYNIILNDVLHEIEAGPEDIDVFYDAFNKVENLNEKDIYGHIQKVAVSDDLASQIIEETTEEKQPKNEDEDTGEIETINEALSTDKSSLADTLQKSSIENIATGLTINQRYMFKSALFNNDEELMTKTLEYIDGCSEKKQALDYILKEFPHWNIEGDEFEEFVELINKRLN